ncbi:MAG: hypothetical protein JWM10_4898 [Myxococcaceae bacterium]|nr:hypothetical protein [Myxococcaceae bacterium]
MIDALLDEMAALGREQHSRFDAAAFRAIGADAAGLLWAETRDAPGAEVVLRSYLRLLAEAVGMGCAARDPSGAHANLLSLLFAELVPVLLPAVAPARRPRALADAWNLGEGLLSEPAWMNRYAAALCAPVASLDDFPAHLAAVLAPALAPRPASGWLGPSTVRVLDARSVRDDFLPGAMHLAAPSVVCVHDRRAPRSQLGLFLDYAGQSSLLGPTPCLGANLREGALPPVAFARNAAEIAGRAVPLPWLRAPQDTLVTAAGFVLATSADSQRLWVIDTP